MLSAPLALAETPVLLEAVDYAVDVSGPVAELVITQRFRNTSEGFVDATYLVPLDDGAEVDAMTVAVGGRTLRSEIRERSAAGEALARGAAAGRTVALDQHRRPRVFAQDLRHLPPGEAVEVELHVVQPVDWVDGEWQLVVPLVVAPRVLSPGEMDEIGGPFPPPEGRDAQDDRARLAVATGVRATVDVVVHAGVPIDSLTSPSHPTDPVVDGAEGRVVLRDVSLARDAIVRWRTAGEVPAAGLLVAGEYGVLVVEPPLVAADDARAPREIVWVVNTGGKMPGAPLALAKRAVSAALGAMDPRDSFSILTPESDERALAARPVPATPAAIDDGQRFVAALTESGGPWVIPALRAALALPVDPTRRRMVVLLTERLWPNDWSVLQAIAEAHHVTFVALGVGYATDREGLDEMAAVGGGVAAYAQPADGDEGIDGLLAAMERPVWSDLTVDWGTCAVRAAVPSHLPDVRMGRPVRILARFEGPCDGEVTLQARIGAAEVAQVVAPSVVPHERAIASAWARERVTEIERLERWRAAPEASAQIRQIGLDAQIETRETSFVVVGPEGVAASGEGAVAAVPLALPDEVEVSAVYQAAFLGKIPWYWCSHGCRGPVLDDAVLTDPVSRTFGFDFDPRGPGSGGFAARLPSRTGGATGVSGDGLPAATAPAGSVDVGADVTGADGPTGGHLSGALAGPAVRDRAWFAVRASAEAQQVGGVASRALSGAASVAAQPAAHHRLGAEGAAEGGSVGDEERAPYAALRAGARWTWEPAPALRVTTVAGATHHAVGAAARDVIELRSALALRPRWEWHALAAGLGVARAAWTDLDPALLASAFAEDRWTVLPNLELAGGARVEARVDGGWDVRASPRLFVAWDPFASGRTAVELEVGRDTAPERWSPGAPLPTTDTVALRVRRALTRQLWAEVDGEITRSAFPFAAPPALVPVPGALPTVERTVPQLRLALAKAPARRWEAELSWVFALPAQVDPARLLDPLAPFVPGFLDPQREHQLAARAQWALPTDPWTATIGARAGWGSAIDAAAGRWWLAARTDLRVWYVQAFDLRRGHLDLRLVGAWVANDPEATVLPLQAFVIVPELPIAAAAMRAEAGLSWVW